MDNNTLWSLRLGFSGRQAKSIEKEGITLFLKNSFAAPADTSLPAFMAGEPRTATEITEFRNKFKGLENGKVLEAKHRSKSAYDLKAWWIGKMVHDNYPLREKMTVFWHNHFVSTIKKINVNYWIYDHNMLLRENAFGNFRELTKSVLRTNAMVKYLDNTDNRKGKYNENLSRELLELFTLGIGNYTEEDIKNGAKGLAGLTVGDKGAKYEPKHEDDTPFTYFGKTGAFKSDEMVDIIFKQKSAPYFITKRILQWFIYDNPPKELIEYYGDYLREQDYEIKPLLIKIFTEEFNKPTAGSKIKDPLVYTIQLLDELNANNQSDRLIAYFTRNQSMDLFNQPNVKGWQGGNSWLTAQLFLDRNALADQLCKGKNLNTSLFKKTGGEISEYISHFDVKIAVEKAANNKEVIAQLKNRLLFNADENLQKDFETILKHDFDPNSKYADDGIMRLFNYMIKTPEFQLI
jgi:uncharacterized protein (DUF1800 family)